MVVYSLLSSTILFLIRDIDFNLSSLGRFFEYQTEYLSTYLDFPTFDIISVFVALNLINHLLIDSLKFLLSNLIFNHT